MPEVERHPRQSIGGLWGVALFLSLPLRFQPESVIHRGCSALFRYLIFDVADVRLEWRQPGPPRFVPGGLGAIPALRKWNERLGQLVIVRDGFF
jgi:hypothetical protein